MSTPAAHDDDLIAAARAADVLQAEHFRAVLGTECEQLQDRMMTHEQALANYQRLGQLIQARRIQHEIRLDERERETLHCLIEALDERFPRPGLQLTGADLRAAADREPTDPRGPAFGAGQRTPGRGAHAPTRVNALRW